MQRSPQSPNNTPVRTELTIVTPAPPPDDKRPYIFGIAAGLLAGLFSAYIFKRASAEEPAGRKPASTGQIFAVIMSILTLVRQIAEMGKSPQKK
jgi:hypothetical protein